MATTVTSRKLVVSHAVCFAFLEVGKDGRVECARMDYTRRGRKSVRHIVETGEPDETIEQTIMAEDPDHGIKHEAAENFKEFAWEFISRKPILMELSQDQADPSGLHLKIAFAVRKTAGEFRKKTMVDRNEVGGDEEVGPPTMVEIAELVRQTDGKTVPYHVRVTKAALASLAGNRAVFDRYQDLVAKWRTPELSQEELDAIAAYPGKWVG